MSLSIVIPVFNSEGNLAELVRRTKQLLENRYIFEIIFVDDCSTDGSKDVLTNLVNEYPFITAIFLKTNKGQDFALLTGLRYVNYDVVVIMDDDLQHDPAFIPQLAEQLDKGYDVCYARFPYRHHSWLKKSGSFLNGLIAVILWQKPLNIYLSPFKSFRRTLLPQITSFCGKYPYLDALILRQKPKLSQIEIPHSRRFSGKGNFSFYRSLKIFLTHLFGFKKFFGLICFLIAVLSLLLMLMFNCSMILKALLVVVFLKSFSLAVIGFWIYYNNNFVKTSNAQEIGQIINHKNNEPHG